MPPAFLTTTIQKLGPALSFLPLPAESKKFLDFVQKSAKHGYHGLGSLCYGNNNERKLRVSVSSAEETLLFVTRFKELLLNPKQWGDHHHLAGTNDETRRGSKGNYTALVSDFPLAN